MLFRSTYHVFAIRVGGVDDVGFDTSVTGTNLVTDHSATHVRRIGSVLRESAALVPFTQQGDKFLRTSPVLDVSVAIAATTANTRTLSVPTGIVVDAVINAIAIYGSNTAAVWISSLDQTDAAPSVTVAPLYNLQNVSGGLDRKSVV